MSDGFSAASQGPAASPTEPQDATADSLPEPMLPEGVKPVSFKPAPLEEKNVESSHHQSRAPRKQEATQAPSGRREQCLDFNEGQPRDAAPLIRLATEPQPFLKPVFAGDLEMDAPPLQRSRLDGGVEEVEPASVRGKAGVALTENNDQETSQARQGRKRKARALKLGSQLAFFALAKWQFELAAKDTAVHVFSRMC